MQLILALRFYDKIVVFLASSQNTGICTVNVKYAVTKP